MKKTSVQISSGNITGTWYILHLARLHPGISVKAAMRIISNAKASDKGDVIADNALKICLYFNFIQIDRGNIVLTSRSVSNILPLCSDEHINLDSKRAILKEILLKKSFEWLMFFDEDIEIFKLLIPDSDWLDLLEQAKLFDFSDETVNQWWRDVLKRYEEFGEEKKKEIGDVGEDLSYNYELKRIQDDGQTNPKFYVKWAARFRSDYGFDILSIRSIYFKGTFNEKDKIRIETKSTVFTDKQSYRFIVTRNEWKKAIDQLESYFFYCWTGIDVKSGTAKEGPFIVPATSLKDHIPLDNSIDCEWTECRFVIDINKFCIN